MVGVLTALGLWLIEMPLVLALAPIAGLFSFVPFLGPLASAVPALLIAFGQGRAEAVRVVAVYSGVQFLEGNFITPIIQLRAVSLPPAVLLGSQLLMGLFLGLVGILVATPMAVAVLVAVQLLYVRRLLGERVPVLGEHGVGPPSPRRQGG